MKANGVIIGAGIIGSALAFELSRRGVKDIHVVDPDLDGALSSTERNAGGVRHLWSQEVNSELSRHSILFFETIAKEIGFQQTGYLWLFDKDHAPNGEKMLANCQSRGLSYEKWNIAQIQQHYPFLDRLENIAFALFGRKDGLLNSNALKNYFREKAKANGVTFHNRKWITHVAEKKGEGEISVSSLSSHEEAEKILSHPSGATALSEKWSARFTVLCTGAWSAKLLEGMVEDPLVKPIRRQIAVFRAEDFNLNAYGMVVDSSGVYFHPEGGNILAGLVLKNEPEGFRFDVDPDFFESHLWPALYERSSKMERLKFVTGWGGLYSYTPDTTGLLGKLPGFENIYESHSFTGRGLMQSYGAAIALSELIMTGRFSTFDASSLHRSRFSQPNGNLLHEGLHI